MKSIEVSKSNKVQILDLVYNNQKIVEPRKFKIDDLIRLFKAKHIF